MQDGDALITEAATYWVVRSSWQGSTQDLVRIARKLEEFVDGVTVDVVGRMGRESFDSADRFAEGATSRLLARATTIRMSGESQELSLEVRFLRRPERLDGAGRVSGVAARVWVAATSARDDGLRARDAVALEVDLGEDPISGKAFTGGAQDSYAAAWRTATGTRNYWLVALSVAAVLVPLAIAAELHDYLEAGKSTLTDVILWCACNKTLLYGMPFLMAAAYAFLVRALPAVDIGERPAWRRVVWPLGKISGVSYLIAAIGKALIG